MFKNVVVGIDGSANGRDAVQLASRLMDPAAGLTLAHVHPGEHHPLRAVSPALLAEEREASSKLLEREAEATAVDAKLVSVTAASPGKGLHGQAELQAADLLVVGSSRRGLLGRVILGDDTRGALNGAPCAVAVAAAGYAATGAPIERIGVAYNSSPESRAALEVAQELARSMRASVIALEVVAVPPVIHTAMIPPLTGESAEMLVEEARSRLEGVPDVEGRAVYGVPGEELAAFGDELDLLVVGSRSYGPARRMVVGSTSNYLERHARCSLLTLPRSALAPSEEHGSAATAGSAVA